MLVAVGLWVLVCLARPFNWWRTLLVAAMAGSVAIIMIVPWLRDFYALRFPDTTAIAEMLVISGLAAFGIEMVWQYTRRSIARRNPEYLAASTELDG